MLINTVILFLRDALPIFVLLALIVAQVPLLKRQLLLIIGVGLVVALTFIQQVDWLGDLFEGSGLELSLFALHLCLYFLVLAFGYVKLKPSADPMQGLGLGFSLIIVIIVSKGSNFLLYFNGHLNQLEALQAMSVGTFLGLGICLSLAILLYFLMNWLKTRYGAMAPWIVLLVFASGQLMNALNLLVQVDMLPSGSPVWDSQWLIDDESEYGHLLNVLFGYLATPSLLQLCLYVLLIAVPLLLFLRVTIFPHAYRGIKQ